MDASIVKSNFPLLSQVNTPADCRALDNDQLEQLAKELRLYLLETLHDCGGHLGAGLGVVELTLALHHVFDTPTDKVVWDVGHQAYPHKILTGRKDTLSTIRQKDGLAPFPRREESDYDTFGVGHSSTSISAALGMALAAKQAGRSEAHIAVIGDGAMTAGMAFEALNHAGDCDCDLLIILNDNDMSISGNVGALSNYFSRILASKWYSHVRESGVRVLKHMPQMRDIAQRTETHIKGMVSPGTVFEEMGIHYVGPTDGHNIESLVKTLKNMKDRKGPQLLHVITQKGKGYAPAEADPIGYHAVSKGFYRRSPAKETRVATTAPATKKKPSFSAIFGDWLCETTEKEPRLIAITPAMCEGSGMVKFAKQYPDHYIDVGIAEQHSVALAAGLACGHSKPVVAIYSTFLQRAYDQLIHDVAIQNLPVLFALDRAGLVTDGPTHSGNFDISFMRAIPNMVIMTPADEQECWTLLNTGFECGTPAAIRYPRGTGPGTPILDKSSTYPIGRADVRRTGKKIALLAFGTLLQEALAVGETLDATVVNMRFVKPLDEDLVCTLGHTHDLIVTLEENVIMGGAGSAVGECLSAHDIYVSQLNIGLPDYFVEHGSQSEMRESCGLDEASILAAIQEKVSKLSCKNNRTIVDSPLAEK